MMDYAVMRAWREGGLRHILAAGALAPRDDDAPALLPPFSDCLARAKARPTFALTYLELGYDLCGRSDPARRELWTGLIAHCGNMAGKTVFAPCTAPRDNGLRFDAGSFWECIGRLGPRYLLLFGEDAAEALFPFARGLGDLWYSHNLTVLLFPGTAALLPFPNELSRQAGERIKALQ
ncbi:MAG: hypothetical protein HQK81_00885 [Desulfovibrionaceae bacterium]|nr:hypothetical protein [Desulfovibrionaceae bacterium]MBF0512602.1 hypothetical protein [Desulfovibrionaceae bacterium]